MRGEDYWNKSMRELFNDLASAVGNPTINLHTTIAKLIDIKISEEEGKNAEKLAVYTKSLTRASWTLAFLTLVYTVATIVNLIHMLR